MVLASEIDIAILSETRVDPKVRLVRLINDKLVLVTSNLHPLATKQTILLTELSNEKFIIPNRDSGLYKNFIQACHAAQFEPKILYQCNQVETILAFVCDGLGVTLLSTSVVSNYKHYDISCIPVKPSIARRISLAYLKDEKLSPALSVFIKYFQNQHHAQS